MSRTSWSEPATVQQGAQRKAWWLVVVVSVVLALASLASNITSVAQQSGQADTWLTIRFTISKVLNAGVVWAGLPFCAGWLVRGRWRAAGAGILACLLALTVHYGVGQLSNQFDSSVWSDNSSWFLVATILGGPLGLIGAAAHRLDILGLMAKLVLPVGAVLEPFSAGMFTTPAFLPLPDRVSNAVSGTVLLVGGVLGIIAVLRRHRRRRVELHRSKQA